MDKILYLVKVTSSKEYVINFSVYNELICPQF